MASNVFSHRILTEDINRSDVIGIVAKHFDAFTVTLTWGYWKGKAEPALDIELIGAAYADARRVALEIKDANKQESVLLFSVQGKSILV